MLNNWQTYLLTDISMPRQHKNLSAKNMLPEGYIVYGANGAIGFYNEYNHEEETVCITCRGASCGNVHLTKPKSYITSNAMAINNLAENVNKKYLYYYLLNYDFKKVISGSAQPQITREKLSKVEVSVPPVKEQQKIAAILTSVDEVIEKTETIIAQTEKVKKGLMQELLTKGIGHTEFRETEIGEIPKEWQVKKLSDMLAEKVIVSHLDGNHGSLYPKSNEFVNKGVPYISANCIKYGEVEFGNAKFLPPKRANQFKKGVAVNNDVLFAHNATVGPVAVLKTELDFVILSTTLTYYRCDTSMLNPYYLYFYMQSPMFINQYSKVMAQSTRNQVPITIQREFFHVLPSREEQDQIVEILKSVDDKLVNEKQKLSKLKSIKKGLMQVLLTGKIRVKVNAPEVISS